MLKRFREDQTGQALIEYTLLLAFVTLSSAAMFLSVGNNIKGIWTTTNSQLTIANSMISH